MKYEQIAELLNSISERFDWEKIMEGDNIIGLKQVSIFSIACSWIPYCRFHTLFCLFACLPLFMVLLENFYESNNIYLAYSFHFSAFSF